MHNLQSCCVIYIQICFQQMLNISRRDSCLVKARNMGFGLLYDPPSASNRCFYRCITEFLSMDESVVVNMTEKYMLENQYLPIENEVRVPLLIPSLLYVISLN